MVAPGISVTDAERGLRSITGRAVRVGTHADDVGTALAVDTFRRTADLIGMRCRVVGLVAVPALNVRGADASGPVDVVIHRPGGVPAPPYGLGHRLAWLSGDALEVAERELTTWRGLVAGWAEAASKPMCAQVQQDLVAALAHDLDVRAAVATLRGSLTLGLPDGALFETWAWADRLLGLDLASDVGR
jgi:hypothetical protein